MQISSPAFPYFCDCDLYFRYFFILKKKPFFFPQSSGSLDFRQRLRCAGYRFLREMNLGASIIFLFPVQAAKFQHGGQFITGLRLYDCELQNVCVEVVQ